MGYKMPIYILTMSYIDNRNGVTDKQYRANLVDFDTAKTAAAAFVTDAQAITSAGIFKWTLAEENIVASTPTPGGNNVTDRLSASTFLDQALNKKYNLLVPAPAPAILSGNTLNKTTAWVDFTSNLVTPWQVSDGENLDDGGTPGNETISGKLITVRSGVRTLPSN